MKRGSEGDRGAGARAQRGVAIELCVMGKKIDWRGSMDGGQVLLSAGLRQLEVLTTMHGHRGSLRHGRAKVGGHNSPRVIFGSLVHSIVIYVLSCHAGSQLRV